ncbi:hypothetical protein PsorP6_001577 [Peronosclerospora sorghi]|uniref:Uncharacterized protein n=1 Tax=Peronosclerospora sorghi TaxID=230839 RepID=A0ACC0WTJ0_9STRA|nr:hypothetical protein PsorP6_001577 [Peronosclerospora sorghi]
MVPQTFAPSESWLPGHVYLEVFIERSNLGRILTRASLQHDANMVTYCRVCKRLHLQRHIVLTN